MHKTSHPISRQHLINPNHQEIDDLVKKYDLHEIVEKDLKENYTQDKIDVYDKVMFLVLHFPKYEKLSRKHYSNEFNFIVGKDFLLSFSKHTTKTIENIKVQYANDLKEADKEDKELMNSPYYILYRIIDELHDKVLIGLRKFTKDVNLVQEQIFEDKFSDKSLLSDLLIKSRNIAFLKNMLVPQEEILEELNKTTLKLFEGNLDVYFEDLQYKVDKLNNLIETLTDNIESLSNKYNTLVSLKTNTIVSVLTIVTVIVWIMTLVTGFYGMNVELPWQNQGFMRLVVLVAMILFALAMVFIFRKKRRM